MAAIGSGKIRVELGDSQVRHHRRLSIPLSGISLPICHNNAPPASSSSSSTSWTLVDLGHSLFERNLKFQQILWSPTDPRMRLVSALLLVLFTAIKLGGVLWMSRFPVEKTYTFLGDDYPHVWPLRLPESRVLMPVHDTVRYQLDTEDGAAEWAASYPGNGFVYLGQQCRPFTISMFHQIRCLDHIRTALVDVHSNRTSGNVDSHLTLHCLNYLRQMALCRSHSYLDPVLGYPIPNAHPDTDVCQDWSAVYRELQKNQQRCGV